MPIPFDTLANRYLIQGDSAALDLLVKFDDLGDLCAYLNEVYRRGEPIVSDTIYDRVFLASLREQQPDHHFLHQVEPEPVSTNLRLVAHKKPMLSTAKSYNQEGVNSYVRSVLRAAQELGITTQFSLTAKLDGIAASDDGQVVATRGDGLQGTDVSHIVEQGVVFHGGRGRGRGEIVVDQDTFDTKLGRDTEYGLEHVRNFVAGYVGADTLKAHHKLALAEGAIHFVPFDTLPATIVDADTLMAEWEALYDQVIADCPYLTDGVVVEVTDQMLREAMGATSHHERAVLAIKKQGETAVTRVEGVRLTVGRTGRIIPTLLLEPVYLSGATISKATAHTASNLAKLKLGEGAQIIVVRSGEVIPKIESVIAPSDSPVLVTHCPECDTPVIEEGEHMVCPNAIGCIAQAEAGLRHWFYTIANADGFGPSAITRLVDAGISDLPSIYTMSEADFVGVGFGPGQAKNLVSELQRSRSEAVRDWRWLASFGIRHLGRGDARKLLAEIPLEQLKGVTADQIASIDGFGPITSTAIAESLHRLWPTIERMLALGFNLQSDVDASPAAGSNALSGRKIVFTGTMVTAKRKDLEVAASELGAQVQSSVSTSTDWLVAGEKAGSKLDKAKKLNESGKATIEIMTEQEYISRI